VEVHRPVTPARDWASSALAVLLVLVGISAFAFSRRTGHTNRLRLAKATATASAQTILAVVRGDRAQLNVAAVLLGGRVDVNDAAARIALRPISTTNRAQTTGLAVATPDGKVTMRPLSGPLGNTAPFDLDAQPNWKVALALSRDDGQARTVADRGPGNRLLVMNEVPLYGSTDGPDSVETRRTMLVGYVVSLEMPDALTSSSLSGSAAFVGAELLQNNTVLSVSDGATGRSADSASVVVAVADPSLNWSVATWPRSTRSLLPFEYLAAGLLLGVIAAVVADTGRRARRAAAAAAEARSLELSFVGRIGPLLQRSLDVGEVLPFFAVELDDELGLDAITISRVGPTGGFVRIFSHGPAVRVPRFPAELDVRPEWVKPGGTISLALQRGGRTIGALTARTRSGLEPSQVHALQAVTDLLSAALGNARLFQQEQEMVERLRQLDHMKTTFLGSVSHELRTMVTAIKGFAGLLSMRGVTLSETDRLDYLERIDRNAASLGLLVDDLLDFARLDRHTFTVTPQPVNLSELVPAVVEQTSSILPEHRLTMTMAPDVVAVADPSAVERILVNLLSNAAKYTPPNTTVDVTVDRLATKATITVTDDGPGIPASERERIFDRFYRVDNHAARTTRGVGIGLALVLELVKLLEGTITVSDGPKGGTRFTVELPLAVELMPT
jgi:signal transduction histidine kinase